MTLKEIKEPFEQLIKSNGFIAKDANITDIINKFKASGCKDSLCLSILFHEAWPALDSIYYNQKNTMPLSPEECYDIFLDTFNYIIESSPWENENSKLYGDDKAFLRAMRTCIKHRKLNYIEAQFKHKRVANTGAISIDYLNDEFQEGYFFKEEEPDEFEENKKDIVTFIRELFTAKKYLDAFILDLILYDNVFVCGQFSVKKLRLALRHIDDKYINYFSKTYKVDRDEVEYSLKYFTNYSNDTLTEHIEKCLQSFRNDDIIKHILF